MFSRKKWMSLFALATVVSACAVPPVVVEKPVIQTVVVEKEVVVEKPVVQTVLVEKEKVIEKPVVQTVLVEKLVTVVVEKEVVVAPPPPVLAEGFVKPVLLRPDGGPFGDITSLSIVIWEVTGERKKCGLEGCNSPAGKTEVELWANPEFKFWDRYWILTNPVTVWLETGATMEAKFVLGRIETKPTPGPTREPTPTPVLPRPTPTPTPTPVHD